MAATILCADDDRNFCQILSRTFQKEGYRVETVHDGESALRRIEELAPALVTLDVMLPRRDGFAVLEWLRRREPKGGRTPVILFSGCTFDSEYAARARALEADAVLQKPVPLDALLAEVARRVGGRAPAERAQMPGGAVTLEGTFEETPFPVVLHHLHGMRASGALQLQSGKRKKQVQMREGVPVAVRSNLVNETLGNLLVSTGKITPDILHESVLRVKRGEGLQGQILKAMHMLDEEDLAHALRVQAEEKLFEIFTWRTGRFRFRRGARVKDANTLALRISPAQVVVRGVMERLPLEVVDAFLEAQATRAAVAGESPFYRFQDVHLDGDARSVLERLDGATTLADLFPLDEGERRTLYALLTLELLELREPKKRAPGAANSGWKLREVHRHVQSAEERAMSPALHDEVRRELTAMAERQRDADCFEVLGVARTADDAEIRTAYAALAKRTHPDRFAGAPEAVLRLAEEVFGAISRAYENVGDRDSRIAYLREERDRVERDKELAEGQRALRAELEFQKGETALRAKRFAEALEHFTRAAETYPEEGEYQAYQGYAWYLAEPDAPGRVEGAIRRVQQGRKLAPDREKPYLFLGRLFRAAGRADVAEKMFTRAVQLDPDAVEALRELRLINMRREKSRGIVGKILRRS